MTEEVEIQPELEDESDYSEKELHLLMGNWWKWNMTLQRQLIVFLLTRESRRDQPLLRMIRDWRVELRPWRNKWNISREKLEMLLCQPLLLLILVLYKQPTFNLRNQQTQLKSCQDREDHFQSSLQWDSQPMSQWNSCVGVSWKPTWILMKNQACGCMKKLNYVGLGRTNIRQTACRRTKIQ